jgi:hypothetical protein
MSETAATYSNSKPLTLDDLDRMLETIKALPELKPDKVDIYATDMLQGRVMELRNEWLKPELSLGRRVLIVPRSYQLTAYKIFRDAGHEVRLFSRDPGEGGADAGEGDV